MKNFIPFLISFSIFCCAARNRNSSNSQSPHDLDNSLFNGLIVEGETYDNVHLHYDEHIVEKGTIPSTISTIEDAKKALHDSLFLPFSPKVSKEVYNQLKNEAETIDPYVLKIHFAVLGNDLLQYAKYILKVFNAHYLKRNPIFVINSFYQIDALIIKSKDAMQIFSILTVRLAMILKIKDPIHLWKVKLFVQTPSPLILAHLKSLKIENTLIRSAYLILEEPSSLTCYLDALSDILAYQGHDSFLYPSTVTLLFVINANEIQSAFAAQYFDSLVSNLNIIHGSAFHQIIEVLVNTSNICQETFSLFMKKIDPLLSNIKLQDILENYNLVGSESTHFNLLTFRQKFIITNRTNVPPLMKPLLQFHSDDPQSISEFPSFYSGSNFKFDMSHKRLSKTFTSLPYLPITYCKNCLKTIALNKIQVRLYSKHDRKAFIPTFYSVSNHQLWNLSDNDILAIALPFCSPTIRKLVSSKAPDFKELNSQFVKNHSKLLKDVFNEAILGSNCTIALQSELKRLIIDNMRSLLIMDKSFTAMSKLNDFLEIADNNFQVSLYHGNRMTELSCFLEFVTEKVLTSLEKFGVSNNQSRLALSFPNNLKPLETLIASDYIVSIMIIHCINPQAFLDTLFPGNSGIVIGDPGKMKFYTPEMAVYFSLPLLIHGKTKLKDIDLHKSYTVPIISLMITRGFMFQDFSDKIISSANYLTIRQIFRLQPPSLRVKFAEEFLSANRSQLPLTVFYFLSKSNSLSLDYSIPESKLAKNICNCLESSNLRLLSRFGSDIETFRCSITGVPHSKSDLNIKCLKIRESLLVTHFLPTDSTALRNLVNNIYNESKQFNSINNFYSLLDSDDLFTRNGSYQKVFDQIREIEELYQRSLIWPKRNLKLRLDCLICRTALEFEAQRSGYSIGNNSGASQFAKSLIQEMKYKSDEEICGLSSNSKNSSLAQSSITKNETPLMNRDTTKSPISSNALPNTKKPSESAPKDEPIKANVLSKKEFLKAAKSKPKVVPPIKDNPSVGCAQVPLVPVVATNRVPAIRIYQMFEYFSFDIHGLATPLESHPPLKELKSLVTKNNGLDFFVCKDFFEFLFCEKKAKRKYWEDFTFLRDYGKDLWSPTVRSMEYFKFDVKDLEGLSELESKKLASILYYSDFKKNTDQLHTEKAHATLICDANKTPCISKSVIYAKKRQNLSSQIKSMIYAIEHPVSEKLALNTSLKAPKYKNNKNVPKNENSTSKEKNNNSQKIQVAEGKEKPKMPKCEDVVIKKQIETKVEKYLEEEEGQVQITKDMSEKKIKQLLEEHVEKQIEEPEPTIEESPIDYLNMDISEYVSIEDDNVYRDIGEVSESYEDSTVSKSTCTNAYDSSVDSPMNALNSSASMTDCSNSSIVSSKSSPEDLDRTYMGVSSVAVDSVPPSPPSIQTLPLRYSEYEFFPHLSQYYTPTKGPSVMIPKTPTYMMSPPKVSYFPLELHMQPQFYNVYYPGMQEETTTPPPIQYGCSLRNIINRGIKNINPENFASSYNEFLNDMNQASYVAFDMEMTGVYPSGDYINRALFRTLVEGALEKRSFEIGFAFFYVNNQRRVTHSIRWSTYLGEALCRADIDPGFINQLESTGFSFEKFNCERIGRARFFSRDLAAILMGKTIIVHNGISDFLFFLKEYTDVNFPTVDHLAAYVRDSMKYSFIDTRVWKLSQGSTLPEAELGRLYEGIFGCQMEKHHSAANDAHACGMIALHALQTDPRSIHKVINQLPYKE